MSFQTDFRKMMQRAADKMDKVVVHSAFKIYESIDNKTPVGDASQWAHPDAAPAGYTGGQLRANWNISFNSIDTSTSAQTDYSSKLSEAAGELNRYRLGDSITITNSLPYAAAIEYGHSNQAPQGMVRITAEEFKSYVREVAAQL